MTGVIVNAELAVDPAVRLSDEGVALIVTVPFVEVGLGGVGGGVGLLGGVPLEPGVTTDTEPKENAA